MTDGECQPVAVSRRIGAPAHDIFQVLADPARHLEFDGSGSLRGAGSAGVIAGVGDVFVMKMYYPHLGDYEMNNHVVEYEQTGGSAGSPRPGAGIPTPPRTVRGRPAGDSGGATSSPPMARMRPS